MSHLLTASKDGISFTMPLSSLSRRSMMAFTTGVLAFSPFRARGEAGPPSLPMALQTRSGKDMRVPNVDILDSDEHSVSLSRWAGKTFLLHLWATWCVPCIRELPEIESIFALNDPKLLPIVPVACRSGNAGKVRAFFEKKKLHHLPVYTDEKGILDREFQKNNDLSAAYPSTFLIEPGLRVRSLYQDTIHWTPAGLRDLMKAL